MKRLRELLTEYKTITRDIISSLESEDYNNLDSLIEKKQSIIDSINEIDYTKEDFEVICSDLNILPLQRKLDSIFQEKFSAAREGLKKAIAGRQINNSYVQSSRIDSIYFNKKI